MNKTTLFRRESLERLQSGSDYDQLHVTVHRPLWTLVTAIGLIFCFAAAWAVFGRIPVTVEGVGVLINPRRVQGIQATASGQVAELLVREGQSVDAGQVIATLNQTELRQELQQQQQKRDQLLAYNTGEAELDEVRRNLELDSIRHQTSFITTELKNLTELTARIQKENSAFFKEEFRALDQGRTLTANISESLREQLQAMQTLREKGAASRTALLDAESSVVDSQARVTDLEIKMRGITLKKIEHEQNQLNNQNRLSDLKLQLLKLSLQEKQLLQRLAERQHTRNSNLTDAEAGIARIELRLTRESQVVSQAAGRILEVAVSPGQVIQAGSRIGTLNLDSSEADLRAFAYFKVRDGKRIPPGAAVRVTPGIVKRERFGSILGLTESVSEYPVTKDAIVHLVGNPEIANTLLPAGGAIQVEVRLKADAESVSGYRWTSQGPPVQLSAGTTASVRVTIEERSPVSYVLPILRGWVFGQSDNDPSPLTKKTAS